MYFRSIHYAGDHKNFSQGCARYTGKIYRAYQMLLRGSHLEPIVFFIIKCKNLICGILIYFGCPRTSKNH